MSDIASLKKTPPIILAIDTPDLDTAKSWIDATEGLISAYKIGLEFFSRHGALGVQSLREFSDSDLFLDMKLHDIPNTVAAATEQLSSLSPRFLTVHASGGRSMISAAVVAAPEVSITAVTVLTSLDASQLVEIGFSEPPLPSAITLAKLAKNAGARAIVCSPLEIAGIRAAVGEEMTLITPGVRLAAAAKDDQARTMEPRSALEAGANYLVIGRPITSGSGGVTGVRERAKAMAQEVM